MNMAELAVYRLLERNKITNEEAMVLASLLENKEMNLLELSIERSLELGQLKDAVNYLVKKEIIQFRNGNYYIEDVLESLNRLVEEEKEVKVFEQVLNES